MDTSALQQNAAKTVHRLAIGKLPSRTLKVKVIAITYGFGDHPRSPAMSPLNRAHTISYIPL